MAKHLAAAKIDPDLGATIEAHAERLERSKSWLYAKLILLGWKQYQRDLQRKTKPAKAT